MSYQSGQMLFVQKPFKPHAVTFRLQCFNSDAERPRSHKTLRQLLNALTAHNVFYLREHPEAPRLYESGIRYQEEELGQENWDDIATVLQQGWGDCEDLACWRSAEVIVLGERQRQHAAWRRLGSPWHRVRSTPVFRFRKITPTTTLYHILCLHEIDGRRMLEDPSRRLGMGTRPSVYAELARRYREEQHATSGLNPHWPAAA